VKIDVAIVGAGPAGAWAAYHLARKGARVRLFDPTHPREKPCGGGVTGRALALVSRAVEVPKLPASIITHARFSSSHSKQSPIVPLSAEPENRAGTRTLAPGLVVASRKEFDRALLRAAQEAGAELVTARVVGVAVQSDGVHLETTRGPVIAGFIIGADGANSLVRRRLSRPFRRSELSIATGYFVHGLSGREIAIHLVAQPPGYIWSFPRPSHLAIGICAQADAGFTSLALREQTAAWMVKTAIADGGRLESYSWPVPSLDLDGFQQLKLSGDRWSLVGDAAGLVDPITREGIYFALLSGEWAADALGAGAAAGSYAQRVREEILTELSRAARLKATFFRPSFMTLLIHALDRSAAIRDVMADLIAGRQSYAGLKWRLLKTFEARLAWRAVADTERW